MKDLKTYKYKLPDHFNLYDIMESGQVFMYYPHEKGFIIQTLNKRAYLEEDGDRLIIKTDHDPAIFLHYLDYDYDYERDFQLLEDMGFPSDVLEYSDGIRLLNQDLEEIVFSFIISQNNNIKRIKKIINALRESVGDKMSDSFGEYYSFPRADQINKLSVEDLREMGAGYRDKYIKNTAEFLTNNPDFLAQTIKLDTKSAHAELLTLSGVGPKVADCILLFGMGKRDVFPLDTWMEKVFLERFYQEKNRVKMANAGTKAYGNLAGLAQQLYFYHIRTAGK
ncbi:DNA-3-methyladenine glycosylase family protein [Ezakiella peruensis]|uniref:DNA-3-methyladenine glycosylase family protein n=1 Tax=Ezakiella peruensis TaxID=1464038 RepID=UPI000C1B34DB|nr:DNA glycosylase [Ezakiella peruensis]